MTMMNRNLVFFFALLCFSASNVALAQEKPDAPAKTKSASIVVLESNPNGPRGMMNLVGALKSALYKKSYTPKARTGVREPERRVRTLELLSKAEAQYSRTLKPQSLRRLAFAVDELYERFRKDAEVMEAGDFSRLLRLRGQLLVDRGELEFAAAVYTFFFDLNPSVDLAVLAPASQESRDLAEKVMGSRQRRAKGKILIRDVAPGTQLWLDGSFAGVVNERTISLPQGIHWYRLIRDGYFTKGGLINVQAGQIHSIRGPLEALPGQANVEQEIAAIKTQMKSGKGAGKESLTRLRDAVQSDILVVLARSSSQGKGHLQIWAVKPDGSVWEQRVLWPKAVRWSEWVGKTFTPIFSNRP